MWTIFLISVISSFADDLNLNNLDIINWYYPSITSLPRGGHRSIFYKELVRNCRELIPDHIIDTTTVNSLKTYLGSYL